MYTQKKKIRSKTIDVYNDNNTLYVMWKIVATEY